MTAVAVLHPKVPRNVVEPFRLVVPRLSIQEEIDVSTSAALIFGGDGTIHRHLPQLFQYKIPALVVPKGSGNDFAKALGIWNERIALAAWKHFCAHGDNVREIDLGVIRKDGPETLFCCVAGAGLDSEANARANRMPAWLRGTVGYLIAALHSAATFQSTDVRITGDDFDVRRPGLLVAAGNAHRYGKGIKVTPQAQLDDGVLDVCLVGRMNKLKLLPILPTVFFGAHVWFKEVECFRTRRLRLETGRPLALYADGEYIGDTPVEIGIFPGALKVIVPVR